MEQPVNFQVSAGIGHLELNRPQAANTINMPLAEALHDAATALSADDSVRTVLLTGAGDRFCGGGDISDIASASDQGQFIRDLATTADAAVQVLENLDRPIIAAVQGAVAGGGLGIMLAADVIIAAEDTKFVFAYPNIGLTPDCGASVSLPRAMGLQRSLAFALSGRPLSAEQALAQGLITEVAVDPIARAHEIASVWAGTAPKALGATRQLLRQANTTSRAEAGRRESRSIGEHVETTEAQGLIRKFFSRSR